MIKLENLSLTLGGKLLFGGLSANFSSDQRIGIVGRNGSGKSTLLKAINGTFKMDSGIINIEKGKKIAYMPQEMVLESNKTVFDEAMAAFKELLDLKNELDALLHHCEVQHSCESVPEKLERIHELSEQISEVNFEKMERETRQILTGLGFSKHQQSQPVQHLSSGWKMRLLLAKLLLTKADFYMFDEPTNHLDIIAKDWFLDFVKSSKFGFLLVCHDRFFLDHLCDNILDLDQKPAKIYKGNYEEFLSKKELDVEAIKAAAANQEKFIKAKMETINRFRAKSSKAKMAQSMLREVEKIERIYVPQDAPTMHLKFPDVQRAGRIVLNVENLSKSFESNKIFQNLSFKVARGEKVAIIAANGKGKTTLLSCISGKLKPTSGEITLGHNVEATIFEQDQNKALDPAKTVLEEVESSCRTVEQRSRVRPLLGAFLFPGDDVKKKIRVLSGGEKNRVAMIKTLIQNSNFLLLDEPTNHLDIQSKELLLQALQIFKGTILFVSHDRSFLDGLATHILELNPDKIVSYEGNYESYLYQKGKAGAQTGKKAAATNKKNKSQASRKSGAQQHELRKKATRAEQKIEKLEQKIAEVSEKFYTLKYGTPEYTKINDELEKLKQKMAENVKIWENLVERTS